MQLPHCPQSRPQVLMVEGLQNFLFFLLEDAFLFFFVVVVVCFVFEFPLLKPVSHVSTEKYSSPFSWEESSNTRRTFVQLISTLNQVSFFLCNCCLQSKKKTKIVFFTRHVVICEMSLNALVSPQSFPDYDFSSVRPSSFMRESSGLLCKLDAFRGFFFVFFWLNVSSRH